MRENSLKNHNVRISLNNVARVTRSIPSSACACTGLIHFLVIDWYLARSLSACFRYRAPFRLPFFFLFDGRCSELAAALKRGARLSLALIASTFCGDIPPSRFARLSLFCLISLICGSERARERRSGRDNVAATSVSRSRGHTNARTMRYKWTRWSRNSASS
jgi:hypothetical protein